MALGVLLLLVSSCIFSGWLAAVCVEKVPWVAAGPHADPERVRDLERATSERFLRVRQALRPLLPWALLMYPLAIVMLVISD